MPQELHPAIGYYVKKRCSESWSLAEGPIPFYDLTFITAGSAVYRIDGVPHTVRAGEAVFVPQGAARGAQTAGMECVAFNFTLPENERVRLRPVTPYTRIPHIQLLLDEFHREWLTGQLDSLKSVGIFLWILFGFSKDPQESNPHIRRIKEYVTDHLDEKITVADAAAYAGLSPVYCGALFRQEEGCPLLRYIQTMKVHRAAGLLADESLSVGEIADLLGYEDIYYFSRIFKQIMGLSPQAYRRAGSGPR